MRALLAMAVLAPFALAQDTGAAPKPMPKAEQLTPPNPLPGAPLPKDATWQTTASGLRWVVLEKGDEKAATPGIDAIVTVSYAGWLESGTLFDETKAGSPPITFALTRVIKGWTEGLQLMHPGDKVKLHIPWQLAYGEKGSPPQIPAYANLIFDVQLVSFISPPPFAMPADADLKTTASGLRYQVITPGTGRAPEATDTVTVNYAGWLTDGKLFDSSYTKGKPATFPLNGVIKGWTEGVQLMQEGAIYKFVIPASLAYGSQGRGPIPPDATLVFQIELVKVGA
ncbi:MAG TPA: FKBP-type peptidyl-prolyl cis-trans isomerase [Planctomycetota bacterium]|nr:FKBP-type peptidyl-prolyl cis-trans isomerase [Planctomycetota bacterium]